MAGNRGIKHIWGPVRTLLRSMPERTALLILSVITGLLCGLAAVLLKLSIHGIQTLLTAAVPYDKLRYLVLPGLGMLLSFFIRGWSPSNCIPYSSLSGITDVRSGLQKSIYSTCQLIKLQHSVKTASHYRQTFKNLCLHWDRKVGNENAGVRERCGDC